MNTFRNTGLHRLDVAMNWENLKIEEIKADFLMSVKAIDLRWSPCCCSSSRSAMVKKWITMLRHEGALVLPGSARS